MNAHELILLYARLTATLDTLQETRKTAQKPRELSASIAFTATRRDEVKQNMAEALQREVT